MLVMLVAQGEAIGCRISNHSVLGHGTTKRLQIIFLFVDVAALLQTTYVLLYDQQLLLRLLVNIYYA